MKLVKIDEKDLKEAGIPFTKKTLYKWHCTGVHPEMFVKFSNKLFVNYDKFEEMVNGAIQKSLKRAEKLKAAREV